MTGSSKTFGAGWQESANTLRHISCELLAEGTSLWAGHWQRSKWGRGVSISGIHYNLEISLSQQ